MLYDDPGPEGVLPSGRKRPNYTLINANISSRARQDRLPCPEEAKGLKGQTAKIVAEQICLKLDGMSL